MYSKTLVEKRSTGTMTELSFNTTSAAVRGPSLMEWPMRLPTAHDVEQVGPGPLPRRHGVQWWWGEGGSEGPEVTK